MPLGGSNNGPPLDLETEDLESQHLAKLEGVSVEEALRQAHAAAIKRLASKVMAGTASHQEVAILRNILRDNGMVLGVPPEGQAERDAKRPPADLPVLEDPDYE